MESSSIAVDTSALLSILWREPGHEDLETRLLSKQHILMGAPTYMETLMVHRRQGSESLQIIGELVEALGITIVPFNATHAEIAFAAFGSYGKGRHRAALNYGDCMSYAVAKVAGLPLLYVGGDFSQTDIAAA